LCVVGEVTAQVVCVGMCILLQAMACSNNSLTSRRAPGMKSTKEPYISDVHDSV
jgi:hypothetical protein